MKITNARRDENGEWTFDMGMSQEETSFLVELSMTSLLKVGLLKIEETTEEQNFDLNQLAAQGTVQ